LERHLAKPGVILAVSQRYFTSEKYKLITLAASVESVM